MLCNLLGVKTVRPSYECQKSDPRAAQVSALKTSSALKIVHAGGAAECYYMAVPAARIMEKYPSFILARPDVFRRPWDAVVRPEEILIPGQKFFVVPRRTISKLRRGIMRPSIKTITNSFVSKSQLSSAEVVSQQANDAPSINLKSNGKPKACNRRVRFLGIDTINDKESTSANKMENDQRKICSQAKARVLFLDKKERRVRALEPWSSEPSLAAIDERRASDDTAFHDCAH